MHLCTVLDRLFVSEIVHLKHLFHKLQKKKKRFAAKNRRKKRAFTVTTRPQNLPTDNSNSNAPTRSRLRSATLEDATSNNAPSRARARTLESPNKFALRVFTPAHEQYTDDEATDYESEYEEETPHTPGTPQAQRVPSRSARSYASNPPGPSRQSTLEEEPEREISGVASFHDTDSTRPMDLSRFRARVSIKPRQQQDWKEAKNKLALNPRDDNLPFISKSIYKSQIMLENDFHMKIKQIFEKYVIPSGSYEINIKYNQRRQLLTIYREKYQHYVSRSKPVVTPSSTDVPSNSPSTPGSVVLTMASNQKRTKMQSKPTEPLKLTDEEYVALNAEITLEDIQIFDKASQSIMGLLRSSYIEFCKTKEYTAFADAYSSSAKLDLFTALRGEAEICLCCRCGGLV